ncbi:MAG: hypothetical protein RLZZ142_777 [Verrucomicrobiota bacterium]
MPSRLPSLLCGAALCLTLLPPQPLLAQSPQPPTTAPDFAPIAPRLELQDGDTFVFLGDSITHQCL